jgi:O-antigen/teichoic acid export membrane protein
MDLTQYLPSGAKNFIERHPKFRLAFRSFSYLFSERIIKILIGFFVHALLARHLGPIHFGKLSYVVKTVSVFFAFGLFGVDELIIKHLMEGKYSESDILKTVLKMRLKMSMVGLIALTIFLFIFKPEGWMFSLITFIYGINIVFQTFNVYELKFHAHMDFKPLFWANNFSYISASALRVLGVFLSQGVTFFLATYIWGEAVLKILVFKKIGWKKAFSGKYLPELSSVLTKESFPYFLSAFVMLFDQRLSFMFIEKYRTLTELGNYSVAVTLVDLWVFLPTAICAAVFPAIVTAFNGKSPSFDTRIQYLSDIMVWLGVSFFLGVFVSSDLVIHLLYGDRYRNAGRALSLFALTTIPVFFNLARIKWMTLEKRLNEWLWINLSCLVFNLVGHIYFVPEYGVDGAIGSYLTAQVLGNLVMTLFFDSSRKSAILFLKSLTFPIRLFQLIK